MALLKRKILPAILEYLPKEQIIFLIGPRQVGKTSILKLIQAEIVNKKIEFLSFNLEDKDHLDEFNESPKNLIKAIKENYSLSNTNKIIVFIDEIQYLKDPSNFLKYIYDEYKDQIKLIVSGSSSFYLDSKFRDSLSGRKIIFEIKSLDFEEFLNFRNQIKILKALDNINQATKATQDQYHDLVNEFMVYGGYPAVVLENKPEIKKQLLADYVNSYLN